MRLSYLCDCAGEKTVGREHHMETDHIRKHIRAMAGHEVPHCPWRAFRDPLVSEVIHALRFFESGNLAVAQPTPSHRLIEGIGFWNQVYSRIQGKQMDLEREIRNEQLKPSRAPLPMGVRRGR